MAGNIDGKYGASAAYTITLASLATSSTRVAGRESTAVSSIITAAEYYADFMVAGRIRLGTTPTVSKQVDVWAYGSVNDTPTYPDVLTGADGARTITSANVRNSALRLVASMISDATTGLDLWFGPVSLARVFGGTLPKNHGLFVSHDTAVALDATAGNHVLSYTGVYNQYT